MNNIPANDLIPFYVPTLGPEREVRQGALCIVKHSGSAYLEL